MFGMGGLEILTLLVLGLLIFGPNQIPTMVKQVAGVLRQLRRMADHAKRDIQEGLGPDFKDFDVKDLNPRAFVRKHFWEDEEEPATSRASRRKKSATLQLNGRRPPFDAEAT